MLKCIVVGMRNDGIPSYLARRTIRTSNFNQADKKSLYLTAVLSIKQHLRQPRKRNRLLEESKYQYVGKRQKKSCNSDLYRMLELPTYICYVWLTAIHVLRAILVGLDLAYLVDPRGKYNPRPSKKSKNLFQLILVFLDHYTVCESVELLRKPCSLKQKVQGLP